MRILIPVLIFFGYVLPTQAHEFWISPRDYMVAADAQLVADIRVGQMFEGSAYTYLPKKFVRFDLVQNGRVTPVKGRLGDRPALSMPATKEGLVTVVHQTTDIFLSYTETEKFISFLQEKDHKHLILEHERRGLPEKDFRERYSRYAKSLIAVGPGGGEDAIVGLEIEILALRNPYTDDVSSGFPVRALYQGEPSANSQIEVFERAPGGEATKTKYRTDAHGDALIAVQPGAAYLVDSVVIRAVDPDDAGGAVWESVWASLTFAVP